MRNKVLIFSVLAMAALVIALPASARHDNAAFDTGEKVVLKRTVTE